MRNNENLPEKSDLTFQLETDNLILVLRCALLKAEQYKKDQQRIQELEAQVQALSQRTAPVFNFLTN